MANDGISGFMRIPMYMIHEILYFFSDDSYFFDSPLSKLGRSQARQIKSNVETARTPELGSLKNMLKIPTLCLFRPR
eukprot:UN33450